ncbi:tyrosine-type recombinase/integrase [Arthrobacter woluwensis]|uniref:tyrosine-type recombinase/integrase n=1 Tax=Arthrobacter woluwensis TaxID=156980 RepID=UPI003822E106
MKLTTAIDSYIEWIAISKNLSPHTLRAYRSDLAFLARTLDKDTGIDSLSPEAMRGFVAIQRQNGCSDRTIARRVAAIHGFEKWLGETQPGISCALEAKQIRISPKPALPRTASRTDLKALHRHLRNQVAENGNVLDGVRKNPHHATTLVAVSIMLAVGSRVGETSSLKLSDVDLESGRLRILGKGSKTRVVFVTDEWLPRLLGRYIDLRTRLGIDHTYLLFDHTLSPISTASIRRRMHQSSRHAGLSNTLTPHMLRHAAATSLIEEGVDITIVQQLLGHSSVSTTQIYTHVSRSALRTALAAANITGRFFYD